MGGEAERQDGSIAPVESRKASERVGLWSGLSPDGRANVLIALVGFLGTAGIGSIITAYVDLAGKRELERVAHAHEAQMAERAADRAARTEFLPALRESKGDLADRIEVLTFYSAVLPEGDPLHGWVLTLLQQTVAQHEREQALAQAKDAQPESGTANGSRTWKALREDLADTDEAVKTTRDPKARQDAIGKQKTVLAELSVKAGTQLPRPSCPAIPPPQSREPVPASKPGQLWVPGHWERIGDAWRWTAGAWQRERADGKTLFVPGRWSTSSGECRWIPGAFSDLQPLDVAKALLEYKDLQRLRSSGLLGTAGASP